MIKHFPNIAEAEGELFARGFTEFDTGIWVSNCGNFKATVHPCLSNDWVMVAYSQIN